MAWSEDYCKRLVVIAKSGWIKILGGDALALGVWLWWGLWGVSIFKKLICSAPQSCSDLGQVGDIFGGINAFFAALALAAVAYSTYSSRRAFEEEQANSRRAFEEEQRSSREAFEEAQLNSRKAFEEQQQRIFDVDNLEQIRKSYGWAFQVLDEDGIKGAVENRRLAWLTAARHLLRAERLVKSIQTPVYKTIQNEEEEYWRTKFHRALSDPSLSKVSFFADMTTGVPIERVEFSSALVVLAFSVWKEHEADPVDSVNRGELLERPGVVGLRGAHRALQRYAEALPSVKQEWEQYKEAKSGPKAIGGQPDNLAK